MHVHLTNDVRTRLKCILGKINLSFLHDLLEISSKHSLLWRKLWQLFVHVLYKLVSFVSHF